MPGRQRRWRARRRSARRALPAGEETWTCCASTSRWPLHQQTPRGAEPSRRNRLLTCPAVKPATWDRYAGGGPRSPPTRRSTEESNGAADREGGSAGRGTDGPRHRPGGGPVRLSGGVAGARRGDSAEGHRQDREAAGAGGGEGQDGRDRGGRGETGDPDGRGGRGSVAGGVNA